MEVKDSAIVTIALPIVIAAIMFGLGLALERADFDRIWRMPKAALIGLGLKILLLPAIAFGICHAFGLSPEFSVGLVLVAAAPSSAVANVFSKLSKADVALSLCLTAIDNLITAVTLPLYAALAFAHFMGASKDIGLQWGETIKIFALILVPVLLGMAFRAKFPKATVRLDKVLRIASVVVLVVLIVFVVLKNRDLFIAHAGQLAGAVFVFNIFCFVLGYVVSRVAGVSQAQSASIMMATGIQATALVVTIALSFLGNAAFGMPAAFFSLTMYLIAFASLPLVKKLRKTA